MRSYSMVLVCLASTSSIAIADTVTQLAFTIGYDRF